MFDDAAPLKVYGLKVSYFTGKLEAYLRYKRIPYDFVPMTAHDFTHKGRLKTGAMQMPMVELPDGRWITDTTPIIEWLESQYCESSIIPDDPLCAFVARLIEDYADERLWRPAMAYR
jgi:glutathione S-transferase